MGTFTGKAPGNCLTNPACCTGNQGYLSIKFHNEPPKLIPYN
jgi:hypothetical protein